MMDPNHKLVGRSATFPLNIAADHQGTIIAFDEEESRVKIIDEMGEIWEGCESQITLGPPLDLECVIKSQTTQVQ